MTPNETALRDAMAAYDATVKACPANTQFLKGKPCPKCKAEDDEGCRKEILAAGDVVTVVRSFLQSPSQPVVAEADVDRIVRTLYEARPFTVISQALSDATGLPMGDPIPWDAFIASGGDPSGLRWYVEQTIAALAAHPQASPPPVQGVIKSLRKRYLSGAQNIELPRKERTRCSHYVQVLDELTASLTHSQPDTQEGEEIRRLQRDRDVAVRWANQSVEMLQASFFPLAEALRALEAYLRDTPHHNALEAAAARKALAVFDEAEVPAAQQQEQQP